MRITRLDGWAIVATVIIVLAAWLMLVFWLQGLSEETVRSLIRQTARVSLLFFLLAFAASSLRTLFRYPWTAALLRNRRYLGLSFAASHYYHFGLIVALGVLYPHPFLEELTPLRVIGGGLAYLFILAMTITSFAGPRKALGQKRWSLLHTVGSYYFLALFARSYLVRSQEEPGYLVFVAAIAVVLGLRIARRIIESRRQARG